MFNEPLETDSKLVIRDDAVTLKGSHRMGDRRIFLKISQPYTLMKISWTNQILAGSISLERTFNP